MSCEYCNPSKETQAGLRKLRALVGDDSYIAYGSIAGKLFLEMRVNTKRHRSWIGVLFWMLRRVLSTWWKLYKEYSV